MKRAALVLVLLALICCAAFQVKLGAPARGLVKFAPPPVYALWWAKMEQCAGLSAPMASAVSGWWYTENDERMNGEKDGYFLPVSRDIALRKASRSDERLVSEEELHALLSWHGIPNADHPAAYFVTRCHLVAA